MIYDLQFLPMRCSKSNLWERPPHLAAHVQAQQQTIRGRAFTPQVPQAGYLFLSYGSCLFPGLQFDRGMIKCGSDKHSGLTLGELLRTIPVIVSLIWPSTSLANRGVCLGHLAMQSSGFEDNYSQGYADLCLITTFVERSRERHAGRPKILKIEARRYFLPEEQVRGYIMDW